MNKEVNSAFTAKKKMYHQPQISITSIETFSVICASGDNITIAEEGLDPGEAY